MKTLIVLSLVLAGCGWRFVPPPVGLEPSDTEKCAAACKRLDALGCPEGQPLEDGTSCQTFCEKTQEAGHALNPTCVAQIHACPEIDRCTR